MRIAARIASAVSLALALTSTGEAFAQAKPPLKIGVLLPLTGPLAPIAPEQIKGMNLAIKEFGGEVAGRKIEMIVEDDGGTPSVGLTKARKLVTSNNVDVMAGIVASPVALQVAPYFTSIKMPLVISNAGADTITGANCSPFVFRASFSSAQIATPIGRYLAKAGVKSIYMIASDFVAPREFVAGVKRGYESGGGGKVIGEAYAPFGKTQDYGPYIAQARSAGAEVVVPVFFAAEAILFMKQWASYGIKNLPVISPMGLVPPMLRKAQGDASADVISSVNYLAELDTPENKKFVAEFRRDNGADPEEFAVMGYDAMRFVLEAVKARGGDTTNREALAEAISKVSYNGPRGPMSMNPANNSATQNVYIVKSVKKGSEIGYELLETFPNFTDQVEGCKLK